MAGAGHLQPLPGRAGAPGRCVDPTSGQYYDGFQAGADHFTAKSTVPSLVQGDVIAVKYTDSAGGTGDATGHVMVVAGTPQPYNRDGNASTREYAVPVIDSTEEPHGVPRTWAGSPVHLFPDTRRSGTTEYTGVARSWIFIGTGSDDVPTGHRWGANENLTGEYKPTSTRPMTFRTPTCLARVLPSRRESPTFRAPEFNAHAPTVRRER